MKADQIVVELTKDEALVLHDFLARASMRRLRGEEMDYNVEHAAEAVVLASIEGDLERVLAEPFAANYGALIERAREQVVRTHGA